MAANCFAAFLLIAALAIPLVGCVNAATDTPTAMFVFGDSYADTGNHVKCDTPWQPPYGQTWPGTPAGRFSDGKILTDYMASFLNIETPVPYSSFLGCGFPSWGINFAYGGTGIFKTFSAPEGPTLSFQIKEFETILNDCSNLTSLISSSMVLVVMVGNDYVTYLIEHPHDWKGIVSSAIPSVVNGIANSISELYNIGFRKFSIANLEPLGCIPFFAASENQCNETINFGSTIHNDLLATKLTNISADLDGIEITPLNQFEAFRYVQENNFDNNLSACINSTTNIACSDPEKFFFWDGVHPTQAGWEAVTNMYKEEVLNLTQMYNGGQSLRFKA